MAKKTMEVASWIILTLVLVVGVPFTFLKLGWVQPQVWKTERIIRGVTLITTDADHPYSYKFHVPTAPGFEKIDNVYLSFPVENQVQYVHDVNLGDPMWAEVKSNQEDRRYYRNRLILHLLRPGFSR